jgi:hypothetical protein
MPRALQLFLNGCQLGRDMAYVIAAYTRSTILRQLKAMKSFAIGTTVIMENPRPKPGIFVFPCRLYLLGYLSLSLA